VQGSNAGPPRGNSRPWIKGSARQSTPETLRRPRHGQLDTVWFWYRLSYVWCWNRLFQSKGAWTSDLARYRGWCADLRRRTCCWHGHYLGWAICRLPSGNHVSLRHPIPTRKVRTLVAWVIMTRPAKLVLLRT
jgi:hypothetical protein